MRFDPFDRSQLEDTGHAGPAYYLDTVLKKWTRKCKNRHEGDFYCVLEARTGVEPV